MNAPFHPASPTHKANPGPTPPRGLGRVIGRLDIQRHPVLSAAVGWCLVIAALACTWWARSQPAELSAGKVALVVVLLVAMSAGTAIGGTRCKR